MSFPTYTLEELAEIERINKKENPFVKQVPTKAVEISRKLVEKTPGVLDGLLLLTIAFWYFFFTGLAVLFGRTLPKEWLKIGVDLNKGKIARKIKPEAITKQDQIAEKPKYKVVDLDSNKPINVPLEAPALSK